jgi:hypothetical protein
MKKDQAAKAPPAPPPKAVAPVEETKPKKTELRKCCPTPKGDGPHDPSCKHLLPKKPPKPKKEKPAHGRLPDGAKFSAVYNAAAETWTGTLNIPGCPEFETTHGGLFRWFSRLDALYRAWLVREEKIAESAPD